MSRRRRMPPRCFKSTTGNTKRPLAWVQRALEGERRPQSEHRHPHRHPLPSPPFPSSSRSLPNHPRAISRHCPGNKAITSGTMTMTMTATAMATTCLSLPPRWADAYEDKDGLREAVKTLSAVSTRTMMGICAGSAPEGGDQVLV